MGLSSPILTNEHIHPIQEPYIQLFEHCKIIYCQSCYHIKTFEKIQ